MVPHKWQDSSEKRNTLPTSCASTLKPSQKWQKSYRNWRRCIHLSSKDLNKSLTSDIKIHRKHKWRTLLSVYINCQLQSRCMYTILLLETPQKWVVLKATTSSLKPSIWAFRLEQPLQKWQKSYKSGDPTLLSLPSNHLKKFQEGTVKFSITAHSSTSIEVYTTEITENCAPCQNLLSNHLCELQSSYKNFLNPPRKLTDNCAYRRLQWKNTCTLSTSPP